MTKSTLVTAYQEAIVRSSIKIRNKGVLVAPSGTHLIKAQEELVFLYIAVTTDGIIKAAKHTGAKDPNVQIILEIICEKFKEIPIQEVSDHGISQVMHHLFPQAEVKAVEGISLPNNSGKPFSLALNLVRSIYGSYKAKINPEEKNNEFLIRPTLTWNSLDQNSRGKKVKKILKDFLKIRGLNSQAIQFVNIEADLNGYEIRINVAFDEKIEHKQKPLLIRALERALKEGIDRTLSVYMEQVKDKNVIRRL